MTTEIPLPHCPNGLWVDGQWYVCERGAGHDYSELHAALIGSRTKESTPTVEIEWRT